MRGLGNGYTQILLNGEPVANGFSLDAIAPETIERIEILRSATAEMSNQAVAGAINIILKRAVTRGQRSITASVARQDNVNTPALSAQLSDQSDAYSYSLAATLTRKHNEKPFTDWQEQRDANDALTLLRRTPQTESGRTDALTLTPRLNWKLADGDTISWQSFAYLRRMDNLARADETALIGAHSEYPHNDANFIANFVMLRSDLQWTHLLADGAKLETKLGAATNRRTSVFDFHGRDADGKPLSRHHVDSGRWKIPSQAPAPIAIRSASSMRLPSAGTPATPCAAKTATKPCSTPTTSKQAQTTPTTAQRSSASPCSLRMSGKSPSSIRSTSACATNGSIPPAAPKPPTRRMR
jgi:outer membrane receptor protein involved in Fe transport